MDGFFQELRSHTEAEIHDDEVHKRIYSVDASIFEIMPLGIAIPKTKPDLLNILKIAKKYQVAVIPRGAATGITGGCLGKALIIDLSKYLTRILEINIEEGYAIVEPGVVQDQLNDALFPFGYRLGPDTSTGNRATIGGMLANNSAGSRSLYYGKMIDHVLEVEMANANGDLLTFKALDDVELNEKLLEQTEQGNIYRKVDQILALNKHEIEEHFPDIPRRVSGYNLDLIKTKNNFDLCKLIVGSEGTLGITTKIKLRIAKAPKNLGVCIIHFSDMIEGIKQVPYLLTFKPMALEMIDDIIIHTGMQHPDMKGKLDFLVGNPTMIFVAEFGADSVDELNGKLKNFEEAIKDIGYARFSTIEKEKMETVWKLRKSGLGLLLSKKSYSRAIAFIEDLSIPPEHLASFMEKFLNYMDSIGKTAGIYGHVGSGCMHIRPYIDLRETKELATMEKIMLDVSDLVLEHGGALTGEHGDGIIRTWLTKKMFGKQLTRAFVEVKHAFDPENRMNPGKIVNGQPLLENLRIDPLTQFAKIETFLDFSREGGFDLAVDLCNGNGMCRKKEGVMCPSFQASHDEYDTTRARAQTLRAIVNGHVAKQSLTSDETLDVLDLCLECKGCKTECPSQVDMAKIKAEVLYQYQEKHGYFLRNCLFGNIGVINRFTSYFPKIFNFFSKTWVFKGVLGWIGISKSRNLPKMAGMKFSVWFSSYSQMIEGKDRKQVILFNDTYNEFNEPEIGIKAVKVLNHLGYEVIVLPWACCGRPMISKGLLKQAKEKALKLQNLLLPYAKRGIPIIGLEPSCILTIKDDFEALIGNESTEIVRVAITFDEFMNKQDFVTLSKTKQTIKVHGHCHQKSLVGMKPTVELLNKLNLDVQLIDSGCCGMAGSFGYEKEHAEFSMKIGELKLFPAIREADEKTMLVANGISCRTQIKTGTGRSAKHMAEILFEQFQLPL